MFARHHYLSHRLHRAATCYLATAQLPGHQPAPVGFLATIHQPGYTGYRRIHRLVILPDFQGLGFGLQFLNTIADIEAIKSKRLAITTSHPALIAALKRCQQWQLKKHITRLILQQGLNRIEGRKYARGSFGRPTATFTYNPPPPPPLAA